jgi:hypothetical protein
VDEFGKARLRDGDCRRGLAGLHSPRSVCPAWANDDDPHAILFSSRDIWLNGAFAHGGFLFALSGLDQDGLLLKILFSGRLYRYDAKNLGGQQVVGAEGLAHVLGGWRVKRGDAEFKFFFGPEFQKHHLLPDDPSNRLRGNFLGLRMAFEVWYEPSPSSMVAADASLSSIATSNSARVAYGWRVFEEMLGGVYLGPVIEYFGSDGYRHLRLGAHLTSMKAEEIEWSAAAGWAQDSQGRASAYVRLNMLRRL